MLSDTVAALLGDCACFPDVAGALLAATCLCDGFGDPDSILKGFFLLFFAVAVHSLQKHMPVPCVIYTTDNSSQASIHRIRCIGEDDRIHIGCFLHYQQADGEDYPRSCFVFVHHLDDRFAEVSALTSCFEPELGLTLVLAEAEPLPSSPKR